MSFEAQVFNFEEIQFTSFSFAVCDFGVILKKLMPNPRRCGWTPMFPSKSFTVSALHLDLIFS